ncbi:hypothetical protein OG311_18170 [Streptomyces sp. NBC_01343]|uniref:hypothetical protein n=1 Tax=Streptomyces sp. NBC_01343 TaxID=2903832 RepID=UPI002E113376|nr:hypothetical protein OG311_18170 [Streptomyces sp. NBC_01343]
MTVHIRDARTGGSQRTVKLPGALRNPGIVSSSGRHLLVGAETDGVPRKPVLDIDAGKVLDIKPAPAAGLWGSLLWQPEGDKGVVAATDLRTGQVVRHVDLGSACRPYELQANGDWFYSTCAADGAGAAAYHVPTRRRIPLPFVAERPLGRVRLGDGYVVQDNAGLNLYNLRSGQPVKEYQVQQYVAGYGLDWSVDRFGGRPAHLDQGETIHVVGVTGAASPLGVIDLVWDGKDQAGRVVINGAYDWTLLAVPADGQGAQLKATGPVTLTGAKLPTGRGRP